MNRRTLIIKNRIVLRLTEGDSNAYEGDSNKAARGYKEFDGENEREYSPTWFQRIMKRKW